MDSISGTKTDMRARLVDATVRLLADRGPGAVQARTLTREIGASTMAVYHYFGGMPQLLAAVIDEGFRRLDGKLAEVPITDDPVTDICHLGLAYRDTARANPHLYDLMFGLSAPNGHSPQEHTAPPASGDSSPSQEAFGHLVDAAARSIRAGRIRDHDPCHVAAQFWSLLHGYVTLEMAGHFDQFDGPRQVLLPMGINLLVGLGDSSDRAARSAEPIERARSEAQ